MLAVSDRPENHASAPRTSPAFAAASINFLKGHGGRREEGRHRARENDWTPTLDGSSFRPLGTSGLLDEVHPRQKDPHGNGPCLGEKPSKHGLPSYLTCAWYRKKETTFFLGHIMGITGINQDEIRNLGEDVSSPEHP